MFVYHVCASVKLMFSIFSDFVYADGTGISIWSNSPTSVKCLNWIVINHLENFETPPPLNIRYCKEQYSFYHVNFEGYPT